MPSEDAADCLRILVVDDNPAIHDDFRKILAAPQTRAELSSLRAQLFGTKRAGETQRFELVVASQGEDAVLQVERACGEERPFALAFVDVRMPPGLNGIETIARMWRVDPNLQAVICTAYSDHSWDDIVQSLGQSDGLLVLRKPFDPIEVLQIAHAMTRKWRLSAIVRKQLAEMEATIAERTRNLQQVNERLRLEIDQRARIEDDLKHLATHDVLTGLPNRLLLREHLDRALAVAARRKGLIGLMMLDLDHFKEVNDSHGHEVGDELLRRVSERLKSCVRSSDVVARMGGDEFVVLLEDLSEGEQAAIVAERILSACAQPLLLGEHEVQATPSIGIAVFPNDSATAESLLKAADLAMYAAKANGRATYHYFSEAMLESSLEKLELRAQLAHAVERDELRLWYQPLVDLRTGALSGVEALLRWDHPELGLVPPLKFVPLAEKTGLIVPIGAHVLRSACQQLAAWREQGLRELSVAVNVSARQIQEPEFVSVVAEALAAAALPPELLHLEITETTAMHDLDLSARVLHRLNDMGVRLVIDDFGSGYSSLERLKQLPVHALKIERLFVKDIQNDPRDAAIVCAIVSLAHSLGLTVVAEGVETAEQLDCLRGLQWAHEVKPMCDLVQGFLLSRPLPAEAAGTLLRSLSRASDAAQQVKIAVAV